MEAVVAYFKILSQHLLEGIFSNEPRFRSDISEYEAGVPTILQRRSVWRHSITNIIFSSLYKKKSMATTIGLTDQLFILAHQPQNVCLVHFCYTHRAWPKMRFILLSIIIHGFNV
jgi:hypothetical protein